MQYALVTLMLLLCGRVAAQEIETLPPGEDTIVSVTKGQAAPFNGQLFDTNTALRWGFWLQQYKVHLKLDVDTALKTCAVNSAHDAQVFTIQLQTATAVEKDLRDRLLQSEKARLTAEEEARNPPWYRSREFGFITGIVGSAIVVALTISAVHSAAM